MKRIFFCLALLAGLVCACGDDDDPKYEGGNAKVTLDGKTVNFSRAYYALTSDGECGFIFANFDVNSGSVPKKYSMLMISVPSQNGRIPTGTFSKGEYNLTLVVNQSRDNENVFDYYLEENEDTTGDLVISKNGGEYVISINDMQLEGEKDGENGGWVTLSTSFNYSGSVAKANITME